MADGAHQEDRTEAATPRRLQKAREEGQVPVSRELVGFTVLAAVTLVLVLVAPMIGHDLVLRLSAFLARAHDLPPATPVLRLAGLAWWHGAAPFVLAAMLAGAVTVLVQTRFLLSGRTLRVDLSRVSPRAG